MGSRWIWRLEGFNVRLFRLNVELSLPVRFMRVLSVDGIFTSGWILSEVCSLLRSVLEIIRGSQHEHWWSELHFRESQCWTFTLSDLPWRCACQNVKITWLLVCLVWLLEWLRWNNVTHWFYILLLIQDFWKCNFWLSMAKKILWLFPSAVKDFADRWIDSKWKWRLEKTFQQAYRLEGWPKQHLIGIQSQEKLTKPQTNK